MATVEAIEVEATRGRSWPLERVLFLLAGTMTLLSAALAALLTPWFLLLTAFVGANQLAYVAFGNCPSSWLLQRFLGFERGCAR
jgi:predicted signal transduction protein with EAL and GGDEF domain